MNVSQVLRDAWEAVDESGVPEELREAAFREAVALIRGGAGSAASATPATPAVSRTPRQQGSRQLPRRGKPTPTEEQSKAAPIDADAFFARLVHESGAPEHELREVFTISRDRTAVEFALPTRRLGTTAVQQARTVVVLLAGARHAGLGESRVDIALIRQECERRGCYNSKKFSNPWISELKGFNLNGQGLVLNPKWLREFDEALARAAERVPAS